MDVKRFSKGKEVRLKGYPICPGIAIARPFFFTKAEENIPEFSVPTDQIEREIDRYYHALSSSQKDLQFLRDRMKKEGGKEAVDILGSHLEMMRDPLMTVRVEQEIRKKGKNTEYVFKSVIGEYEQKFSKITDTFFQERLKDVQDISRRVIGHLRKHERSSLNDLTYPSVIFAHELSPSDTAEARTDTIEAFVTRSGSETSHVAIMARAKGIPFVSNVDFPDLSISLPPLVIVDGCSGEVIINPTEETLTCYEEEQKKQKSQAKGLQQSGILEAETIDGYKTRVSANIETFNELDSLQEYGVKSIGLFRSEYLFLGRDVFPTEDEQFVIYRSVVEKVDGNASVIRTFDIGGDKLGNVHLSRHEKNPYLGCRAVRLMLKEPALFKTQIRAILRASAFGEVFILFPMISSVLELREAKGILEEAKAELLREGIPFARNLPVGCMIEVPSAALTSDLLIRECDFLSIGTNDLVQYALAVDRGNPTMSYLYSPTHPSIIRLIKLVVDEGNRARKPVSVCGEIAADPKFTPLLLGLGVHELSVSTPAVPIIKNAIRHTTLVGAHALAERVLTLSSEKEIEELLNQTYHELGLDALQKRC